MFEYVLDLVRDSQQLGERCVLVTLSFYGAVVLVEGIGGLCFAGPGGTP
jgi:hypothetical protein